jgi:hypothetical protein
LLSANLSASLLLALIVKKVTTSLQPDKDADIKTQTFAIAAGRRSSRDGFFSSSNLKI